MTTYSMNEIEELVDCGLNALKANEPYDAGREYLVKHLMYVLITRSIPPAYTKTITLHMLLNGLP